MILFIRLIGVRKVKIRRSQECIEWLDRWGVSRNAGLLISVKALYAARTPQSPKGEVHPQLEFEGNGSSPFRRRSELASH